MPLRPRQAGRPIILGLPDKLKPQAFCLSPAAFTIVAVHECPFGVIDRLFNASIDCCLNRKKAQTLSLAQVCRFHAINPLDQTQVGSHEASTRT